MLYEFKIHGVHLRHIHLESSPMKSAITYNGQVGLMPLQSLSCLLHQGRWKQPGDGPAKLSTIPRIMSTQATRGGSGGMPPLRKFLKIRCPNMLFLTHFHYQHERYIVHYTQGTNSTKCQYTK